MATFRVCCDSSERRSGPGTSGCAVAASASVLRGKGLRISSDRDLYHAHGSWSGSGVGNRESHRRKSRMVEISLSGSGEGPGGETSRPTLQRTFLPSPAIDQFRKAVEEQDAGPALLLKARLQYVHGETIVVGHVVGAYAAREGDRLESHRPPL